MNRSHRVVIVGASLAGLTTAESLRLEGYDGEIVILGDEPHLPYSRPPLSKQVLLDDWGLEHCLLRSADELSELRIDIRLASAAVGIDIAERTVTTTNRRVRYDDLVIASGARARSVPNAWGARTLRTFEDAEAIRADLLTGTRLVVLGAGILGSEIASAGRAWGADVTLVGRSSSLAFGSVGEALSDRLEALHHRNDVELRLGRAARGIEPADRGSRVTLADGESINADVVVAAIGGVPNVEWLAGSGLPIDDGVVCDHRGLAAPGVYAVGDAAAWYDPLSHAPVRVEHQTNAIEQAMSVAALIVRDHTSPPPVPFFWSEIHGTRIKAYGWFPPGQPLVATADSPPDRPLLLSSAESTAVTGAVAWNAPPTAFRAGRTLVDESANRTRGLAETKEYR